MQHISPEYISKYINIMAAFVKKLLHSTMTGFPPQPTIFFNPVPRGPPPPPQPPIFFHPAPWGPPPPHLIIEPLHVKNNTHHWNMKPPSRKRFLEKTQKIKTQNLANTSKTCVKKFFLVNLQACRIIAGNFPNWWIKISCAKFLVKPRQLLIQLY